MVQPSTVGKPSTGGRRRPGRLPLTRDRIFRAAYIFVDDHGLRALSMRKLAAELGVEAMSLYNHIDNKDDILAGIGDLVFAEIDIPKRASESWAPWTRRVAHAAREALSDHTNVVPIILAGPNRGTAYLHLMESMLGVMRDAGFDANMAHRGWHTLVAHVLGYVLQQTATPILVSASPGRSPAPTRSIALADLPGDDFPHIVEIAPLLAECRTIDEFDFGLDMILSGLQSKLDNGPGR
ncbi:MAG: TetR/AcrR family transcriptional regulator [Dehalococcoidia bacterium]|jgi:AcrR family transcriptional regulator|nr:TetR/AcrR family transcriptional regulator [Dehalococcoidia bacterium]